MAEIYKQIKQHGKKVFHRNYCLYHKNNITVYDSGAILSVSFEQGQRELSSVKVCFKDGRISEWETKWLDPYIYQFGVAVSYDGKYVFAQTWENGLQCLDATTGERSWRTKSKRGITNIFVNKDTILCHQRERALQLIDIYTGEVLREKRPATAWGFTAIDNERILCQVKVNRWEIIDTETLEASKVNSGIDLTRFMNPNLVEW